MRPAIFFDRDGTLNEEVGYAGCPERFHMIAGAAEAVRRANQAGWAAVLVTNQAGVARGYYPETALAELHRLLATHLDGVGAHLDGVYYCPHHPQGVVAEYAHECDCRKPRAGMVRQAALDLDLDLAASWVVGDRGSDVALAHAVGARAVLVQTGYGPHALAEISGASPEHVAADVLAAVDWILEARP